MACNRIVRLVFIFQDSFSGKTTLSGAPRQLSRRASFFRNSGKRPSLLANFSVSSEAPPSGELASHSDD
jgi:hypothetical protein